jgi:hypothetical protein
LAIKGGFRVLVKELPALRAGNGFLKEKAALKRLYPKLSIMKMGKKVNESSDFGKRPAWPQNIGAMEHGRRPIGKEMAKRLAKVLNTDWRLLLS